MPTLLSIDKQMIGLSPLAALGTHHVHSQRPLSPVAPVVRSGGRTAAVADIAGTQDKVTLRGNSPGAADGLYTRKGTLVASVERQQSFDLTIQTAEGDTATLHFSQSTGSSSALRAQSSGRGSRVETLQESYGALELQVTLQGAFNDEETRAMDQLMQQANRVADSFFAGDTHIASLQAYAMAMRGDSLQSFSLDLHHQEMRRFSATYAEVAQYTAPPTPSAPPAAELSAAMPGTDLLQGLKQLLAQLVNSARDTQTVTDAVDKTALA